MKQLKMKHMNKKEDFSKFLRHFKGYFIRKYRTGKSAIKASEGAIGKSRRRGTIRAGQDF